MLLLCMCFSYQKGTNEIFNKNDNSADTNLEINGNTLNGRVQEFDSGKNFCGFQIC